MTNTEREIVRRLIKGDLLTSVAKSDGSYTYRTEFFVGIGGNSPLRVNTRFAEGLIRLDVVVQISGNVSHLEDVCDYSLLDNYANSLLQASKYSLGDTVEYKLLNAGVVMGTDKGVITEMVDPIGFKVKVNGVTNYEYSASGMIGITRMVLIEKIIKKREIKREIQKQTGYMRIVETDHSEIVTDITDDDFYDTGRYYSMYDYE